MRIPVDDVQLSGSALEILRGKIWETQYCPFCFRYPTACGTWCPLCGNVEFEAGCCGTRKTITICQNRVLVGKEK